MKARLFTLLIALLAIVTGAKAQKIDPIVVSNTLELELYSGEEIPEVGIKLLVLFAEKASLIVRQDGQGGAIFYKGKKELFNIKVRDGEGRVTVPTDVTWEQNPDPVRVTQAELQELGITGDYSRMSVVFSVTINSINFTDGTFRTYVSENFDTNLKNKGRLTKAEAEAVTEINVSEKGITSLKGVEYFTKLEKLTCYRNELTSLDVTKNTALTELVCYWNELTSLDVTKNTALTKLVCWINNLAVLDVTKNTALTELVCYSNPLNSLDVSKNTALTKLYCNRNQLSSLDVSKNTALTELGISDNQLTEIDLSNNTALTKLDCGSNLLTSLNLINNTALTYICCLENRLTSLDVSKNTALDEINCYHNQIRGAGMSALISSLPDNKTGAKLYVYVTPESNVITKLQAQDAIKKGWTPQKWSDNSYCYLDYLGESVPADANGDGEVTAADAEAIIDYILCREAPDRWFDEESADVVDDDAIDIQDLTQLIKMLTEE